MLESVNLPSVKGTFRAVTPGESKLVRIIGCTAKFTYCKGTRWVPLMYITIISTPNHSYEFGHSRSPGVPARKVPLMHGRFMDSTTYIQ